MTGKTELKTGFIVLGLVSILFMSGCGCSEDYTDSNTTTPSVTDGEYGVERLEIIGEGAFP